MAEVLSQEEIDALLNNVPNENKKQSFAHQSEMRENTYLYDFKHPNRVTKDQMRNLRTIHEGFSRILATYLTTLLRTMVDVHLLSIDQVTFLEFTLAMSNPGCIWIFELEDYKGKGIIEVGPEFVLMTIERLFGGEGKHSGEVRPLSAIEQNVSSKIINRFMQLYTEAWEKATPLKTKVIGFEENPQFAQVAPASETTVVMFLEISVRNATFPVNICFPYYVLDPIIEKLSADNWLGPTLKEKTENDAKKVESTLKNSEVLLTVNLGKTDLLLKDILDLEKDDVIILDSEIDDPVEIHVEDRLRFRGHVGTKGDKVAVSVDEVIPFSGVIENALKKRIHGKKEERG
ncbi:flagellar motor switch protein FliM [bacterium]|nr:flagellar motor switch protein FliM [bacterium]